MKAWMSGSVAGTGTFRCTECDFPVSLDAADELPACPNCGGTDFKRSSMFEQPTLRNIAVTGPYMHDGRAATLEEAIRAHTGQGTASATRFSKLAAYEQQQVIAFLKTLHAPNP